MKPKTGQFVKLIFHNGVQMEGVVVSWSTAESVLKAVDGVNFLIVSQTAQDVMAYKIVMDHISPKELPKKFDELVSQFREVYEQPSNDDLRTKKLAQLKIAMIDQEKKIVAQSLKNHTPSQIIGGSYGNSFAQLRSK
jgi:wyosine [tRNA(Phe)-imidazoG37] synthetase (radical SAM superfamily)